MNSLRDDVDRAPVSGGIFLSGFRNVCSMKLVSLKHRIFRLNLRGPVVGIFSQKRKCLYGQAPSLLFLSDECPAAKAVLKQVLFVHLTVWSGDVRP